MNIILLGAPGSGKGYISDYIKNEFNLTHISTGDLLRKNIKEQTEYGKIAQTFIDKGEFAPDYVVLDMLKAEIQKGSENGFIFDGYPRNIAQADALATLTKIDLVLLVDVPKDIIVSRILARRVCSNCASVYSTLSYSKPTCEKCGGELIQRVDDVPEVIENRLLQYEKQTAPLVNYYKSLNLLKIVDNSKEFSITQETVKHIIKNI